MKCKSCGKYIKYVNCHHFAYDGSDSFHKAKINKAKEKGTCYSISAPKTCTMFEFEYSYDEFIENIECPECGKFPFKKDCSINTYEFADVVFGQEKDRTYNSEIEKEV